MKIKNYKSTTISVTYGVSQGSILGPSLFSLYINDLAEIIPNNNLILYADDTVIFDNDIGRLQELLNLTYDWCENYLLTINTYHQYDNDRLFLGKNILEHVQEYKYLGVNMDSEMSFHQQREILHKQY